MSVSRPSIKVLHAAETIKGGVATVIRFLYAGMVASDSGVDARCLVPSNQSQELLGVPESAILTFTSKSRGLAKSFSFLRCFVTAVLKNKPDIVHLHSSFAGAIGRVAIFFLRPIHRCQVVYSPHAFSFLMSGSRWKRCIYGFTERLLLRLVDTEIICVSRYEFDAAIAEGLPKKKLHLVYNGVSDPGAPPLYKRNSFKVPLQLLFIGRFDYQKGFDLLLDAMEKLEHLPIQLRAIGDSVVGGFKKPLRKNIEYLGWVSNDRLSEHYYSADVLIIPSRWEGFAMVPLEAMSHALGILASDSTSLPEAVTSGENGLLFRSGDAEGLANVLKKTTREEWLMMGRNGRARYLKYFTDSRMTSLVLCIYKNITKDSP